MFGNAYDGFIPVHFAAVIFIQHQHCRVFAYDIPTAFHQCGAQVIIAAAGNAFGPFSVATVACVGYQPCIAAQVVKVFKAENILQFK